MFEMMTFRFRTGLLYTLNAWNPGTPHTEVPAREILKFSAFDRTCFSNFNT